ncbi:proline racemase family protein [Colwellia sp. 1_MG-2023]|uniref:proline racemase family protein n=1 Tax=Colwellia sp. 1_MG-2023 TaxID=3062649 RepID=UPI0026E1BB4C|nr:proline racemase family protein [Colwellia sp. 1_MG-2023]MDO6446650.1 proline racemase family protein [Colwellia sp. 1_MG-2023]
MQFNDIKFNNYQSIKTIDAHTEGEPLRIITSGYPKIIGKTILEKRQYLIDNLDHLRQLLMFEPRGHADMYGALITEPCTENADFGILFMHNEGYSSMCGHGIIAAVTAAIETKTINLPTEKNYIGIDSPAGFIKAYATQNNHQLTVSFDNVPAFVEARDQEIFVEGVGQITYDIAFGGAYYVFVDADKLSIDCSADNLQNLINAGRAIKKAVMKSVVINHPEDDALSFLYGTIFTSKSTNEASSHSRHVCIFADGEVDRSPTGTGVSARAALLQVKEDLPPHTPIEIESIVGGRMSLSIQQECNYFDKQAVIPRVGGRAYLTGVHQFLLDENDIFPQGFFLR